MIDINFIHFEDDSSIDVDGFVEPFRLSETQKYFESVIELDSTRAVTSIQLPFLLHKSQFAAIIGN